MISSILDQNQEINVQYLYYTNIYFILWDHRKAHANVLEEIYHETYPFSSDLSSIFAAFLIPEISFYYFKIKHWCTEGRVNLSTINNLEITEGSYNEWLEVNTQTDRRVV